ncbi:MAG: TonB-dependent receptor [Cytophagales bacterium]|nr:MAG: TonB-dependent receptor [Cytophagales bacterium]
MRAIAIIISLLPFFAQAQQLKGYIKNTTGEALEQATLRIVEQNTGTISNANGFFELTLSPNQKNTIVVSYVGYQNDTLQVIPQKNEIYTQNFILKENLLNVIVIESNPIIRPEKIFITEIESQTVRVMPSAFGDFNNLLNTLAGVVTNSELSSTYSVRGGNFDENLVYINQIEVYRPFLVRSGQQEGLSSINPDLVQNAQFSTGGWASEYGDKMASMLNITYKEPTQNKGSFGIGFLTANAHLELTNRTKNKSLLAGFRYKDGRYLFRTLPTKGEYLPRFADLQLLFRFKITPAVQITWLNIYANNDYYFEPTTRETSFGTSTQVLKLTAAFEGFEKLQYEMLQSALNFQINIKKKWQMDWIIAALYTQEKEYQEWEGGYRLCEVIGEENCIDRSSLGTVFQSARNRLQAEIFSIENRNQWQISQYQQLKWGIKVSQETLNDRLLEYSFLDSAGYTYPDASLDAKTQLYSYRWAGYLQHQWQWNQQQHLLQIGFRIGYWTYNQEWIFSPRIQYSFHPQPLNNWTFNLAIGFYQQPPFYRELRNNAGELNPQLLAQKALHCIIGAEHRFKVGQRKFKWTAEAYYKYLNDVVPYDIDNMRIRYFAQNTANAYSYGADLRISGEFVKDAISWLSISFLKTEENIWNNTQNYIRRPTDQRLTVALYLEDYLPKNPTWRVNLQLIFGTGLPFSPPNQPAFRSALNAPFYRRVDIGFAKIIGSTQKTPHLWIGLEVLNLLGIENTISYTWIKDINQQLYAVPNTLSTRFLNLRMLLKF